MHGTIARMEWVVRRYGALTPVVHRSNNKRDRPRRTARILGNAALNSHKSDISRAFTLLPNLRNEALCVAIEHLHSFTEGERVGPVPQREGNSI